MVTIETAGNDVTVRVLGSHKIWALKSVIRFKKNQVLSVERADRSLWPPLFRCPGTAIPWLICAGTYRGKGRKEFWDRTIRGIIGYFAFLVFTKRYLPGESISVQELLP